MREEFDESAFQSSAGRINQSNLKFYILFDHMMIVLLIVLFASTFVTDYASSLNPIYIFFIVLSVAELFIIRFTHPKHDRWIPYACYYGILRHICSVFLQAYFITSRIMRPPILYS